MGLEGSLTDFRTTEIIQLIGQQFKTGVLYVQSGRKLVEVFFLDGLIVHVLANYRTKQDLLGEILLKAKKISQEQLERVLKLQDETLQYVGEIMVELKMLTEEEIVRVISTQVYETIYDLLTWKDGNFRFEPRAVESHKKVSIALSPEHVLLNVLRMMDEWPDIEARLSSLHVVFRKAKTLPGESEEIPHEKQMVYELADGKLSLGDIIDQTLLGKFEVCKTMVGLWDEGYVERVSIRKPGFTRMVGAKVGLSTLTRVSTLMAYAMTCLVAVVMILFLREIVFSDRSLVEKNIPLPRTYLQEIGAERVQKALIVYYLENGEYPDSPESLVNLGLLTERSLDFPSSLSFRYKRRRGGGYILRP